MDKIACIFTFESLEAYLRCVSMRSVLGDVRGERKMQPICQCIHLNERRYNRLFEISKMKIQKWLCKDLYVYIIYIYTSTTLLKSRA